MKGEASHRRGKRHTAPWDAALRRVRRRYTLPKKTVALTPSPSCPRGLAEDEWQAAPRAGPPHGTGEPPAGSAGASARDLLERLRRRDRAPRSFNNHERCACSLEPAHAPAQLKRRRRSTAALFEYYRRGAAKAGTVFVVTQA